MSEKPVVTSRVRLSERVLVPVSPEQYEWLREYAHQMRLSAPAVVRQLLEAEMERHAHAATQAPS